MTASAHKKYFLVIAGVAALTAVTTVYFLTKQPQHQPAPSKETTVISFADNNISAEVARSEADKSKGLGGRGSIGEPGAMLFVYDNPQNLCFWMKDMRFPIDIIWLDANKKIIKIEEAVSPRTYPDSFCSSSPAQFVLELPEGKSREIGMKLDLQLRF